MSIQGAERATDSKPGPRIWNCCCPAGWWQVSKELFSNIFYSTSLLPPSRQPAPPSVHLTQLNFATDPFFLTTGSVDGAGGVSDKFNVACALRIVARKPSELERQALSHANSSQCINLRSSGEGGSDEAEYGR